MTLCGESGAGSAALLSARVEQLEKALQGYRDLLAQHDQDNQAKCKCYRRKKTHINSLRMKSKEWLQLEEAFAYK